MALGDVNYIFIIFFIIFSVLVINVNTALHFLLSAELLWITLYILSLVLGFIFDNVNILSLTFFFLILSAVEFSIGLIIILLQNLFLRSISLVSTNTNSIKFNTRLSKKINHTFTNKHL